MELLFTGTGAAVPESGTDTASCVVGGEIMIDFGWSAPCRLQAYGVEPWNLRAACLTHLHPDHAMGLMQLLFYMYMHPAGRTMPDPMPILGPATGTAEWVEGILSLFRLGGCAGTFPSLDVRPVRPGDGVEAGPWTIEAGPAAHNVDAVSYRIHRTEGGRDVSIVVSGDTAYCPKLVGFAEGADLLVHEASRGASDDTTPSPHARVEDACRVAGEAHVGSLALVHLRGPLREAARQRAQELFDGPSCVPEDGDKLTVGTDEVS